MNYRPFHLGPLQGRRVPGLPYRMVDMPDCFTGFGFVSYGQLAPGWPPDDPATSDILDAPAGGLRVCGTAVVWGEVPR